METKTEDYRNELFYQPKNGYDRIDTEERLVMEQYAEEYKKFLNEARTEREAVKLAVEMAEAQGFVPYERGMEMAPGTKIYFNNRGKSLILAVITGGFSNGGNSGRDYSTNWSGGVDGGDIASRITGNITGIDWALVGGIMAIAAVFAVAVIAIAVIVSIFVLNPIEVGCRRYFIEAAYGEVTMKNISVLVMAFKDGKYGNIVKTMFLKGLYQFLWSLLLIVPGIVKSYEYRMIPYILAENPDVTTEEAVSYTHLTLPTICVPPVKRDDGRRKVGNICAGSFLHRMGSCGWYYMWNCRYFLGKSLCEYDRNSALRDIKAKSNRRLL